MVVQNGRPLLHLTAAGWVNDPLGLTYHAGRYHIFFQYVPGRSSWATGCHWGHATSDDLVAWTEHPVALAPGDGDDGCWSGCLVQRPSGSTIFYTSVSATDVELGRIRTASPVDESWDGWSKDNRAPVVPLPSGEVQVAAFRDPFVWRDEISWRMLVGAGLSGGRGAVLSYSSPDLKGWKFDGVFAQGAAGDPGGSGTIFECPQFFMVDGTHFLVVSAADELGMLRSVYAAGEYSGGRFEAGPWRCLTFGGSYYAASSFTDADGQPGLVHWIRGPGGLDRSGPWAGALSVPHALSCSGSELIAAPHPNLARRGRVTTHTGWRGGSRRVATTSSPFDLGLALSDVRGPLSVRLSSAADGRLLVTVTLDRSAVRVATAEATQAMPAGGGSGALRLLIDHGIAEVFGPAGAALAAVFEAPPDGIAIDVEAGQDAGLAPLALSEISPA